MRLKLLRALQTTLVKHQGLKRPHPEWPSGCLVLVSDSWPCRRMAELEAKLIEEETALRVRQAIEKRVQEVMASDVVQQQLQQHLHTERQRLEKQVCLLSLSFQSLVRLGSSAF